MREVQNKLDLGDRRRLEPKGRRGLERKEQQEQQPQRQDSQAKGPSQAPTAPTSFKRIAPPNLNTFATLEVLHREGFSRWLSGASLPAKIAIKNRDNSPILSPNIPFIIVEKLPPEHYGGTSAFFDLGLCKGVLGHCPVPGGWQFCPYRHWAPEPRETRWMDGGWLERNEGRLARCPVPPDGCEGGYRGVERVDCEWRSVGAVVGPNTGVVFWGKKRWGVGGGVGEEGGEGGEEG